VRRRNPTLPQTNGAASEIPEMQHDRREAKRLGKGESTNAKKGEGKNPSALESLGATNA
jgi:hypothetical protein